MSNMCAPPCICRALDFLLVLLQPVMSYMCELGFIIYCCLCRRIICYSHDSVLVSSLSFFESAGHVVSDIAGTRFRLIQILTWPISEK